ncbi:MAG: methylated-DNA--[protein]-cysteine S-methyltransferase [Rubrivivax sp.]|nr:methylated-DNA--[protein]-cysteine S-methyltransferase [Rubrivivax sp.]MBK8528090.1 methylated-DNA--[protein]-cysteine S-methyltransferase [Rubrivivax sp.]
MKQALKGLGIEALADIDTPLGRMTALATPAGLAALWFDARERYAAQLVDAVEDPDHPHIAAARRWLEAYWADAGTDTITVPLDLHGTLFQRAVWQQLLRIPRGHTRSYGEVAAAIGGGAVARATGAACGANPVGVIVPCHRVIGANGSLTGFAGGLPRKERLLQHEGALLV